MARRAVEAEVEALPEADRLGDYPHPRQTSILYGHDDARARLAAAIDSGDMHHAWLLTGLEGIGKATLAYKAASYALASADERLPNLNISQDTVAGRQVSQLSHPGLLVIRRNYDIKTKRFPTAITIDEVRKLRAFLNHRHVLGQWRVIIIDSGDELNINAANALLKSLEEPPRQTLFFLIATDAGKLLPTVRSRCRLLHLMPLDNDHLLAAAQTAYACVNGKNAKETPPPWHDLQSAAGGSPRRLLALASAGGREIAHSVERIYGALGKADIDFQHSLADRLASTQALPDYELFITLFLEKLAQLIKSTALQPVAADGGFSQAGPVRPEKLASWAELWETLHREAREVKTLNLDRAAFLLDIFMRLERETRN